MNLFADLLASTTAATSQWGHPDRASDSEESPRR